MSSSIYQDRYGDWYSTEWEKHPRALHPSEVRDILRREAEDDDR